ncbi:ATP-dependent helicase HrpB [Sulfurimonas sp. HSL3-7]|uniref:ATP-dependent helicase HrpB n=1 Tax=Sulfonitrofixus jiaomeiensis TaxID=3131938 RepID=UPI0031F9CD01
MQNLPIRQVIPRIVTTLSESNRLVLQAPPGAGKTTAVPLTLLDETWLEGRQIIMLEPRRLAARNAAARMAELLGEKVGETVGYQIRADRCVSSRTKIIVVTEGILTRMLQGDPAIENAALLIFDEFHERSLHGDLALALALQSQALLRDDLKIMVMSATLNTEAIAALLSNAPVITSEGRSFPVENIYLDSKTPHPSPMQLSALIAKTVGDVLRREKGSILVFLPGVREIKKTEAKLRETFKEDNLIIAPLYGDMSKQAQDAAIRPCSEGKRKIVLATNIAETSLTIEGITVVIDAGLQRVATFDSGSGMNRLHTLPVSQDAAVQRSGRAGRLSPGRCYRLWHEHRPLARHSTPEIMTSDLVPMMLELANWGVEEVDELQWLDLPPAAAVEHARELLRELGALEGNTITPHGRKILELGTHPRLAHMILKGSELGYGETGCLIAALLSEKEIFTGSARHSADLSLRVNALQERHSGSHIDQGAFRRVLETASALRKKLNSSGKIKQSRADTVGLLLGFAYPDRIAGCRGPKESRYLLSGGKGAVLNSEDGLFGEPYLVIADLDAAGNNARIFRGAALFETTMQEYFGDLIVKERLTRWNDESERVEAREVTRLGAITLNERPLRNIDDSEIKMALLGAVREKGLDTLTWSKEALALRQRMDFLNYWKEQDDKAAALIGDLPDVSDTWLLEHLEQWLLPHLERVKSFKACRKLDTYTMLSSLLTWDQKKHIDILAPARIKVPSGSDIRLNYEDPASPVLAVRLQELFGMLETPRLINGTVAITIELLSPAHRPMQVTKDLYSFWESTYHEVKKELRGKYKKHYWPDDPFTARATSKTKKNM